MGDDDGERAGGRQTRLVCVSAVLSIAPSCWPDRAEPASRLPAHMHVKVLRSDSAKVNGGGRVPLPAPAAVPALFTGADCMPAGAR